MNQNTKTKQQVSFGRIVGERWAKVKPGDSNILGLGNYACCVVGYAHGLDGQDPLKIELEDYKCMTCAAYSHIFNVILTRAITADNPSRLRYQGSLGWMSDKTFERVAKKNNGATYATIKRNFADHMNKSHKKLLKARGLIK